MPQSVDIEVILKEYSNNISKKAVIGVVRTYLENRRISPNTVITNFEKDEQAIKSFTGDVKAIIVGEIPGNTKSFIDLSCLEITWFVYSLDNYGPIKQHSNDEDELIISTQLSLPSACLMTLWESLYYEDDIKQNLLRYARTMMEFSDKGVDSNIISCNRVILLHGPPGTGKTSLCKALAQKLTIRMSDRFTSGLLLEINSHSLFSKWFSESAKLVNQLFSKIEEMVENRSVLVCILIDEVESLAHARDQCVSGTEPSDSIRVVNALLTQLDQIKSHPNVLIFATSNMTTTIDLAFVDRADIKQFLGLPSVPAIYRIYWSCINELMKAQVIKPQHIEPVENVWNVTVSERSEDVELLWQVCHNSLGLSGRSLRKVPFMAHALYLDEPLVTLKKFLLAAEKAVEKEKIERNHFKNFKQEKV